MTSTIFNIPDLYISPYFIDKIDLENTEYILEYKWNIRDDSPYISIYRIINDGKQYIVRDYRMIIYTDILKFNNSEFLSGSLVLLHKNLSLKNPNIKNISTDYYLMYTSE